MKSVFRMARGGPNNSSNTGANSSNGNLPSSNVDAVKAVKDAKDAQQLSTPPPPAPIVASAPIAAAAPPSQPEAAQPAMPPRDASAASSRSSVSSSSHPVPDRKTFAQSAVSPQPPKEYAFKKENYAYVRTLGEGGYGKVCAVIDKTTGTEVAVKQVAKDRFRDRRGFDKMWKELHLLSSMDHPNLAKLLDWGLGTTNFYAVTELARGGDLFNVIHRQKKLTENQARVVAEKLLSAISYLHQNGVIHRDLKLDNVLINDPNQLDFSTLVITDYGVSTILSPGQLATTVTGSSGYMAPEVLKGEPYGAAADMWSIGVILYILLIGFMPYSGQGYSSELDAILSATTLQCDRKEWSKISKEASQLVANLLSIEPTRRMTAAQALQHSWLRTVPTSGGEDNLYSPSHEETQARRSQDREVHATPGNGYDSDDGSSKSAARARRDR